MDSMKSPVIVVISDAEPDTFLCDGLTSNGINVLKAKGDANSLKLLEIKKPDIIIIHTGSLKFATEMLTVVKGGYKFNEIPVIVLSSGNINSIDKANLIRIGAADCLIKSHESDEILARIKIRLDDYKKIQTLSKENQLLREIAVVDDVTGLFNKRYLMGRISGEVSRALRQGEALSFMIIELDDFKDLVVTYGADIRNFLLKQVAFSLKEIVRLSDVVIRYGESQLAVLCPITDRSGLETLIERLRQNIERRRFEYNGDNIRLSVNIGAYTLISSDFNSFDNKVNNLVIFAEAALKKARENDGNRIEIFE